MSAGARTRLRNVCREVAAYMWVSEWGAGVARQSELMSEWWQLCDWCKWWMGMCECSGMMGDGRRFIRGSKYFTNILQNGSWLLIRGRRDSRDVKWHWVNCCGVTRPLAGQRRREVTLAGQRRREVTLAGQRGTWGDSGRSAGTWGDSGRSAGTWGDSGRSAGNVRWLWQVSGDVRWLWQVQRGREVTLAGQRGREVTLAGQRGTWGDSAGQRRREGWLWQVRRPPGRSRRDRRPPGRSRRDRRPPGRSRRDRRPPGRSRRDRRPPGRSRRDRRPPGRSRRDPWQWLGPRGNWDTRGRESTYSLKDRGREFRWPWVDPGPQAAKMNQGTPWAIAGSGVSVSNGGKLPPRKFLGNSTTSRGHSGRREAQGAFWRCWVSGTLGKR